MKKLLVIILTMTALSANAAEWEYAVQKNDFGNDNKYAELLDDTGRFALNFMQEVNSSDDKGISNAGILIYGSGFTNSACREICEAKINIDGNKALEPIKLLALSNYKVFAIYGSSKERLIDLMKNSKVFKIQLPLASGDTTVTFESNQQLNLDKLQNVK